MALDAFDASGFDAVTVDDIAATAGVSRRTFFRHFPTKDAVLVGDREAELSRLTTTLFDQPAELDLRTALLEAIDTEARLADRSEVDALRARVVKSSGLGPTLVADWERQLATTFAHWVAHRTDRAPDELAVRGIAATLVAVRRVVVDTWVTSGGRDSPRSLAAETLSGIRLEFDD